MTMKNLKYTGAAPSRARLLRPETLDSLGISLKGQLSWDPSNNHTVAVSNENAEILLAKLPGEFEVVSEAEEVEVLDDPPAGTPEVLPTPDADPDASDDDEDDDGEEDD